MPDALPTELIEFWKMNPDGTPPDLHPDLIPFIFTAPEGLICLKHPLIFDIGYIDLKNGYLNAFYEQKVESVAEAERDHDWSQLIWLYERPYRLGCFVGISELLTDEQYWSLLSDIWLDTENMWQEAFTWRLMLESSRPGRYEHFMDDGDRVVFDALPDYFPIYRGTVQNRAPGWSWTLNEERAEWFARRHVRKDHGPVVLSGHVAKGDVIGYLGGRNEEEIVVIENKVQDVHSLDLNVKDNSD